LEHRKNILDKPNMMRTYHARNADRGSDMAAIAGGLFFIGVAGFAVWSIVATLRPRLGKIAFLLQYGPAIGAELPAAPLRVTLRGRPVPLRVSGPASLRLAA
jgi:hypothetical protein